MSLSLSAARATIKRVKIDKKKKGTDAKSLLTALKVELTTSADVLAEFHPSLRAAWFVKGGGVRFKAMKEVGWDGTRRGVDLAVRPGPDIQPAIKLADVTLRDFKLKPMDEAGQQLVRMRMTVDVDDPTARSRLTQLADYLEEEAWIDIHGGGELDLAPPSARTEIEGLEDPPPDEAKTPPPAKVATAAHVDEVRRLQPTRKSVRAKLVSYPDEVLTAAIAAENAAANCRPMFISMIQAELDRRAQEITQ